MTWLRRLPSLVLMAQLAALAGLLACADGADLQQPAAENPIGDPPVGSTPGDSVPADSVPTEPPPPDSTPSDPPPPDSTPSGPLPPDSTPSEPPPPDSTPAEPAGSIVVRTTSDGASFDGDGYAAGVADAASRSLGLEGETRFDGVAAGPQTVRLSGLASNCTVSEGTERAVTVGDGQVEDVVFRVSCTASGVPGKLSLTVHTAGANLDPDGYRVTITGGPALDVATGTVRIVPDVAAGLQRVTLGDIAPNCGLTNGPATREVTIPEDAAGAGAVEFALTCR